MEKKLIPLDAATAPAFPGPVPVRAAVAKMDPYVPGKPIEDVQAELGLVDVIKMASNENPLGPSAKAMAAAAEALRGGHVYPEASSRKLRQVLAERWQVPSDWVFVGNGSDEVFRLLAETYLTPEDAVVVPTPSFSAYTITAQLMGAEVRRVPLNPEQTMDLPAMAAAVQAGDRPARLVWLCRPNNPTGGAFPEGALHSFMQAIPADTLVILDQAYAEYDESGFDARPFLLQYPNLIVSRTFSKIYGLAGLRIGYGLARPELLAPMFTARDPFSVNVVGQAAALAALDDRAHLERSLAINRAGRAQLCKGLEEMGLSYVPTQANFILIDLKRPARPVFDAMLRLGVIIRPCGSFGLPNHIRITIGTEAENLRCLAALWQVLRTLED